MGVKGLFVEKHSPFQHKNRFREWAGTKGWLPPSRNCIYYTIHLLYVLLRMVEISPAFLGTGQGLTQSFFHRDVVLFHTDISSTKSLSAAVQ